MIKIFDDWCNPSVKQIIYNTFTSSELNWNLPTTQYSTVSPDQAKDQMERDSRVVDFPQMVHPIVLEGELTKNTPLAPLILYFIGDFFNTIAPGLGGEEVRVMRVKANLLHKHKVRKKVWYNPPHTDPRFDKDMSRHHVVCLYYITDSDGDTFFFDNDENHGIIKRVSPKPGRMALFDGHHLHASSGPEIADSRIVINTNVSLPCSVKELLGL